MMKCIQGINTTLFLLVMCGLSLNVSAQEKDQKYGTQGWQLEDFRVDTVFGAGVTRAYNELLKGKKSHTVIVAVIDVGVDTAHEDLVGHIWTNTKEIPGNGIDDDHNGYVDDVHGWNFLGGKDGRNITVESYESYREYYRLRKIYSSADSALHSGDPEYAYWQKVKKHFLEDSLMQAQTVTMVAQMIPQLKTTDSLLQVALHKTSVYSRDLEELQTSDSATAKAKKAGLYYFRSFWISKDMSLEKYMVEVNEYLAGEQAKLKAFSDDPNAVRKEIAGDDYNNMNDLNYGNNNVAAGTMMHGTHVSGIIAASRHNGKGMDGIADNVLIMPIRAVPDGDERDKDVALAIRYAVDNGAQIINMSFSKPLSPGKKWVDEAVKYAEDHDVLLVHAAGNEGKDIDTVPDYPNPYFEGLSGKSSTFLTVGANSWGPDSLVVAKFSNYGQKGVDLFAPGVRIYSTVPGNQYEEYSGTSMASPVAAGVAALLLEYYPKLSARQLEYVLIHSAMKLPDSRVKLAQTGKIVDFNSLSVSGGIINAYNAFKLASTMKGKRGKTLRMKVVHRNMD